jgi:hypothetical protein
MKDVDEYFDTLLKWKSEPLPILIKIFQNSLRKILN